ncbi:MAG TPA: DinB family protein [Dehalococcoidia bacterium]
MDPTVTAARDLLAALRDDLCHGLAGQPWEALNWRPYPGGNTIAGLVEHMLESARFQLAWGLGREDPANWPPYQEVAARHFAALTPDAASLLDRIERGVDAVMAELCRYTAADLARELEAGGGRRTGALHVLLVCGHLREHWGQIQATRDLYGALVRGEV